MQPRMKRFLLVFIPALSLLLTSSLWSKVISTPVETFSKGYRHFLSTAKTERIVVHSLTKQAQTQGFVVLEKLLQKGKKVPAGTKFYTTNRHKALILGITGTQPLTAGCRIIEAHGDACRLDLKPKPLYSKEGFTLFQTHYYGGIKNFLYLNIPLALHGTVITKDGTSLEIHIGEEPDDPVLVIPDLLIHLSHLTRKAGAHVSAERLDPIIGNNGNDTTDVRTPILKILAEKYHITEEDFISAELEIVPAGPAREVGLDRSMVGGYGQDDRSCVYAAAQAVFTLPQPKHTALVLIDDKEEVGYPGTTGYRGAFLTETLAQLQALAKKNTRTRTLKKILSLSTLFYCDVSSAINPLFPQVHEHANAAKLGFGPIVNSLPDHIQKIAELRAVFDKNEILWQTGDFGKSPGMSGAPLSTFEQGMPVLYIGLPALSIHSPFSITSKADLYESYRAYKILLQ